MSKRVVISVTAGTLRRVLNRAVRRLNHRDPMAPDDCWTEMVMDAVGDELVMESAKREDSRKVKP